MTNQQALALIELWHNGDNGAGADAIIEFKRRLLEQPDLCEQSQSDEAWQRMLRER